MRITLSAAVTADGFLDDRTPRRLIVSTPEDWAEVHRLRAAHDAIMVGAETLRRDDPALLIRDEALRARRAAAGMSPDIARVSLTASGRLDPSLRFFAADGADRYLFARCELPALASRAAVIRSDEPLTARYVVTELEKRGIRSLFVEGGASVLRLFLDEGLADTLRLAVNPSLRVGALGGAAFAFVPPEGVPCRHERFGGMEVATCTLHRDTTQEDLLLLRRAVAESRRCVPSDSCYRVGAVVATCDGRQFTGYTHETSSTHHAEQEAIAKSAGGGRRAAWCGDLLLDGALLDAAQRTRKLLGADRAPRFRAGRDRIVRTRPVRRLPGSARHARCGRRRALLSGACRGGSGDQRPCPEGVSLR